MGKGSYRVFYGKTIISHAATQIELDLPQSICTLTQTLPDLDANKYQIYPYRYVANELKVNQLD